MLVKQKKKPGNSITYFPKGNYNNKNFTDPFPAGRGNIIESDIYSSFNLAPGQALGLRRKAPFTQNLTFVEGGGFAKRY